ncbi:MAG TPA: glycosyltransferase family 2 protein [Thermoleophilia bacterium]|nr:glycosyltransferase family 2 protein [Thermoleophilia bacterium]
MKPKITFGIIVLNGEPFTRYCLRSLYPFAHQIIVVEGASPAAASISRADGHSRDGTLHVLRSFQSTEDSDGKLTVVTAEDEGHENGFWPGEKDEQSRAYARRTQGDYLWQVDVDEFYREDDMHRVLEILSADPSIDSMTFKMLTFWGGLDYIADSWYLRRGADSYHRLFKWGPGFSYVKHRRPTVADERGRDLRTLHWLSARKTHRLGIRLFHYSLLFPHQVRDKGQYYSNAQHSYRVYGDWNTWMDRAFFSLSSPYRVHNLYHHPSWLVRYTGPHPVQIERMMRDIRTGAFPIELRATDDIERLLRSWWYPVGRAALKASDYLDRLAAVGRHPRSSVRRLVRSADGRQP